MEKNKNPLEYIKVNTQQDNFISACMSGVDPRTGVFNHATTIFDYTSIISDARFSFVLNYNSKLLHTNQGYGYGFTDNLSRYDQERNTLTLSSGQVYNIVNDGVDDQPSLVDFNFGNFSFTKETIKTSSKSESDIIYYIKYVDGISEKLENRDLRGVKQKCYVPSIIYYGIESEIHLAWDYIDNIPYLQTVQEKSSDTINNRYLLSFSNVGENERKIRIYESEPYEYNVFLKWNENNLLIQIRNYGFDPDGKCSWEFKYTNKAGKGRLLSEIRYPCDRRDNIEYRRARDKFNLTLPKGVSLHRVRRYYIRPQSVAGTKKLVTQYTFNPKKHNNRYSSVEEHMDRRFRVIKKITRVYNIFHLLVGESTEVGMTVTDVLYFYNDCDETKELAQQPVTYQCIHEIKTILTDRSHAINNKRDETVFMSYDKKCNLIRQIDGNKSVTLFSYAAQVLHAGILVDIPNGMSLIESMKVMYLNDDANNIVKEYGYELLSKTVTRSEDTGSIMTYKLVQIMERTVINSIEVRKTIFQYYKSIQDREQLGKLKRAIIQCYDRLTVKDFLWAGRDYNSELTLYTKTKTNDLEMTEVLIWDIRTGLLKAVIDSFQRKTEYKRDRIGRLLSTKMITNLNDDKKSKVFQYDYEYKVKSISGVVFYQKTTTDLHKSKIEERYDGLGRLQFVVMKKNNSYKERVLHTYKYDDLSRIDYEEHFSYKDDETFSLISIYAYDDWGYIRTIRHNDGIQENIVTDLIKRTKSHCLVYGDETINETSILFDESNQPVNVRRYYANGKFIQIKLERDYCGRLVKYQDELGNTTRYEYDLFDRVNKIIFPDNSEINKSYSKYSEQPLLEKITFTSVGGEEYQLGNQGFDELDRLVVSLSYGVLTKNIYYLHYPLPVETVFANGSSHIYENDYGLHENILSVVDNHNNFRKEFKYSDEDGTLIKTIYVTPRDIFIEDIKEDIENNFIHINTKFIHDGKMIDLIYEQEGYYNNEGVYKITDETKSEYLYLRDSFGRIKEIKSGKSKKSISYDLFSRISQLEEYNSGGKAVIQYAYDEFSREVSRKCYVFYDSTSLNNQPGMTVSITTSYLENNLIKSRSVEQESDDIKKIIRKEEFTYDVLNRVICYECQGSVPTKDHTNKDLKSVDYTYDQVGNISITDTVYTDDTKVRYSFVYNKNNPFLLSWMQNESSLDLTQYEFNSLGLLINKTHTERVNADFSKKLDVDITYNNFFNLASTRNTMSGTNLSRVSQNIVYRYGSSDKLFFRKSVKDKVKEEEIFTYRGYNDEIINIIDFRNKENYKKITSSPGSLKRVFQKDDQHDITNHILNYHSGTPVFSAKYWGGQYESSEYSTIGVYGSCEKKDIQTGLNGCFHDEETGGYLLGLRVYDPKCMRFNTPDSLSPFHGGNINPYIFCNNNPVNSSDNSGYITRETWKNILYGGAAISIGTGIITLGASIAMSSVLVSIVSIIQIVGGAFTITSLKNNSDDFDLAFNGVITLLNIGQSLFTSTRIFKLPLSKNLKRIFDFNRSLQSIRKLSVNRNRKKISGLNYLGHGVSIFNDTYKKKPRLNIYSHGKKTALIETRMDKPGSPYEVNKLSSRGLDNLLRVTGGVNYEDYAAIRIVACHSGDSRYFKSAIGYDLHHITGLPVKAFHGKVTVFGIPPDTLQSYFEKFSSDPHSLHNIRRKFSAEFELIHNANYSPKYFI